MGTNKVGDEGCWQLYRTALEHGGLFRVVLVHGGPGIGKTFTAQREAIPAGGVVSCTLSKETPASELRGHYMPKGGEFIWTDGPVITAMRRGARLILNEISHASSDVLDFLYPVLESSETAGVHLPNGERVLPAQGFGVVVTDNFPPDQLPAALRDRVDATIHLTGIHPDGLALLPEWLRPVAIQLADESVEESRRVSLRGWLRVLAAERVLGTERAFSLVFGAETGAMLRDAIAFRREVA